MATVNVRCTSGFFVRDRGIVNYGEVIQLSQGEAKDVVSANRGVIITQADYESAPKADFKPKDEDGKVIPPETRTQAQIYAASNREYLRQQQQSRELLSARQPQPTGKEARA